MTDRCTKCGRRLTQDSRRSRRGRRRSRRTARDRRPRSRRFEAAQPVFGPNKSIRLQEGAVYYLGASSSPEMVLLESVGEDRVTYYRFESGTGKADKKSEKRSIFEDLAAKGSETWLDTYGKHYPERSRSIENLLNGDRGKSHDIQQFIERQKRFDLRVEATRPEEAYDARPDRQLELLYGDNAVTQSDGLINVSRAKYDTLESIRENPEYRVVEVDPLA